MLQNRQAEAAGLVSRVEDVSRRERCAMRVIPALAAVWHLLNALDQTKKIACDLNLPQSCPLHVKGIKNALGQWATSKNSIFDHGQECVGCIPAHTVLSLQI